jgi:hypothetical protein
VSVSKEYNMKRHVDKLNCLQIYLKCQQGTFKRQREESETCFKVSYVIAEKIAKESKVSLDGEFLKECLVTAVEILCPCLKTRVRLG